MRARQQLARHESQREVDAEPVAASSGSKQWHEAAALKWILRRESGHAKAAALEDGAAVAHRSSSLSISCANARSDLASLRPAAACAVSSARVGDSVCVMRVRSGPPRAHPDDDVKAVAASSSLSAEAVGHLLVATWPGIPSGLNNF